MLDFIEQMLKEHPNWEFVGKSNCGSGQWAACFREIESERPPLGGFFFICYSYFYL